MTSSDFHTIMSAPGHSRRLSLLESLPATRRSLACVRSSRTSSA